MKNLLRFLIFANVLFWLNVLTAVAQPVPASRVPAGFGRYCSVLYPNGVGIVKALPGFKSDPCRKIGEANPPGGIITRAGLWSVSGKNNVLRTCDGDVGVYRGTGNDIIKTAYEEGTGKKKCVYTVAPVELPVFSRPYRKLVTEDFYDTMYYAHDYNVYNQIWDVTEFGQTPNADCPNSKYIVRSGKQVCDATGHGGYDWLLPTGTQMLAVTDGIVRKARWRDVSGFGGDCAKKNPQGEIYVEHQIGYGEYAERFLTYYAHVSKIYVKDGERVTSGKVIGKSGDTGCSGAPHLHFTVFRTTNLSGYRKLSIGYLDTGYGIDAIHGVIDPYGWKAPKQVDPWAWKFLGVQNDPYLGNITNPGAFSIYLWRGVQAPPLE